MTTKNTSAVRYKRQFMFRSRWFNTRTLYKYHLAIQVGPGSFRASCIAEDTHQCLLIAEYLVDSATPAQWLVALEQLYRQHPWLAAGEWGSVTLSIANQKYTLVPERLFVPGEEEQYLNFACPLEEGYVAQSTVHTSLNAVMVFAVDAVLLNWFRSVYPAESLRVVHQASSLIQGAWTYLHMHQLKPMTRLFVYTEAEYVHVLAIDKGVLLYYNRFARKRGDEIVHYLLIVMRTLQLDTGFHEVIAGGHMTKSCPSYRIARKYIRHIALVKKPPYVRFGWMFRQSTAARYFDILSVHLCR